MAVDILPALSKAEARQLTDLIRRDIEALWARLLDAYERGVHLALGYDEWGAYFKAEFGQSRTRGYQLLDAGRVVRAIEAQSNNVGLAPPTNARQAAAVARESRDPEQQAAIWETAVEVGNGKPTAAIVREVAKERIARPTFNRVNENIDWAWWSWNPVTGCLHNCVYCYARDIANRFYPQKFEPTFLPERLTAPQNTSLPDWDDQRTAAARDPRSRNVFTCSMADLFGSWVPREWIDAVFAAVVAAPQWRFLFLTKFPQRLAELGWPDNAWVGTSVDRQHRVKVAEKAFRGVQAGVKWLSCEPLLEPLRFSSLEMFDWVVIGAQTKSTGAPEFQPPVDWVLDLIAQARDAGCKVYVKPNLIAPAPPCPTCGIAAWPKEVPWEEHHQ